MNNNTKRKIKNAAKTGGKWTLQGIKFAGKGTLTVAQLTSKGIENVAASPKARRILAGAGTLAASVAFAPLAPAAISITALNWMVKNCILDKSCSPVDSLKDTFRGTNSILKGVLDLAAPVIEPIARETSKLAKKGKEALDR